MKSDGRAVARRNEERVLKMLNKFGWLRTRDLAALIWSSTRSMPNKDGFLPEVMLISNSALRMAQRTLQRLRVDRQVINHVAPDGSQIYALSEGGAHTLRAKGIPANSGKNLMRRFSQQQYHHRRISNEVAISALLQGYRVTTEREIASGKWLGGMEGVLGKKPDVLVRSGKTVGWIEVERSRKNLHHDYPKLLEFLNALWPAGSNNWSPAQLPGNHELQQVIFISNKAFIEKLKRDLGELGWNDEQIKKRIGVVQWLYVTDAKFLTI